MERSCLVNRRKTAYYKSKATWLGRDDNYVGTRDKNNPPGRAITDTPPSAQTNSGTIQTRTGAICNMTEQIARLQADMSNRENIKFFIQYITKEMKIMRLRMASEGEREYRPGTRQGGSNSERSYATHQQGGATSYGDGSEPLSGGGKRRSFIAH